MIHLKCLILIKTLTLKFYLILGYPIPLLFRPYPGRRGFGFVLMASVADATAALALPPHPLGLYRELKPATVPVPRDHTCGPVETKVRRKFRSPLVPLSN